MDLKRLSAFDEIVIQCHDNPDADAIASGFGLYRYFSLLRKNVRLIYSGNTRIQKSNLRMMIEELHIPIEQVSRLDNPELLITVDCQYGEGNVTHFSAQNVAVIDHHDLCCRPNDLTEIKSGYGSCATIIYVMLNDAGFDVNSDYGVATALYYGLYMDTNGFGEVKHPLDMDMMQDLSYNRPLFEKLKNSNFSLKELEIAGNALLNYTYEEKNRFAIVKANPCDPNILGMISDLVLQVDGIDICIVYNELDYGFKMSVRSCIRDAKANDIAVYITDKVGSGGGHKTKSGGFIIKSKFSDRYGAIGIEVYLLNRMLDYYGSYDVFDTEKDTADTSKMKEYGKLSMPVGYLRTTDFSPAGTALNIRTLEGDVGIVSGDDIFIMIGTSGEVYPIKKKKFESSYQVSGQPCRIEAEYSPTARNKITGELYQLADLAGSCVPKKNLRIYARQIEQTLKVFSKWDYDNYMLGQAGDYFAVRCDDIQDAYIIKKDVFKKTYAPI